MHCPFCDAEKDRLKVIDSRTCENGRAIRRRRQCVQCSKRFTTYERIDEAPKLSVVKNGGDKQPWDRRKIIAGIERAAFKLDIAPSEFDRIADEVEDEALRNFEREVPTEFIGNRVGDKLGRISKVAYVRFASVYKKFQTAEEFIDETRAVIDAPDLDDDPDQTHLFSEGRANPRKAKTADAGDDSAPAVDRRRTRRARRTSKPA
ncbi:MAG: transcriptional regulator NrdR [Planctomycetota bacterium]